LGKRRNFEICAKPPGPRAALGQAQKERKPNGLRSFCILFFGLNYFYFLFYIIFIFFILFLFYFILFYFYYCFQTAIITIDKL
jgi:hypothetical protein